MTGGRVLSISLLLMLSALTLAPRSSEAQSRLDAAPEWAGFEVGAPSLATPLAPRPAQSGARLHRTLGATLLGSVAGAAATIVYFAVRDEDTYECNACVERGVVAGLTTGIGTGVGARRAGAGLNRSVVASVVGTVTGALVGLALIEPLHAGWPAGMTGYVLAQGLTTGIIAHGGVR